MYVQGLALHFQDSQSLSAGEDKADSLEKAAKDQIALTHLISLAFNVHYMLRRADGSCKDSRK